MNSKIMLAVAVTSVIVAVALAPILITTSADAARTCVGTNGGGQPKDCTSPAAKTCTTTAGQGMGGGETKSTTCP